MKERYKFDPSDYAIATTEYAKELCFQTSKCLFLFASVGVRSLLLAGAPFDVLKSSVVDESLVSSALGGFVSLILLSNLGGLLLDLKER